MQKSFWFSFPISLASIFLSFYLRSLLATDFDKQELSIYYAILDAIYVAVLPFLGFRSTMTVYFANGTAYEKCVLMQRYAMLLLLLPCAFCAYLLSVYLGSDYGFLIVFLLLSSIALGIYFNNQLGMLRMYGAINLISALEPLIILVAYLIFAPMYNAFSLLILSATVFLIPASISFYLKYTKGYAEPSFNSIDLNDAKSFYANSSFAALELGFSIALLFVATIIASNTDALSDFLIVIKPFITYSILLFVFPVMRFIAPEIAKILSQDDIKEYAKLKRFVNFYATFVFLLILFCSFWNKEIVTFIFSSEYVDSAFILFIIPFTIVFSILNTFLLASLKALGAFSSSLAVRICGFLLFCSGYFWITSLDILILWLATANFFMWILSSMLTKLKLKA